MRDIKFRLIKDGKIVGYEEWWLSKKRWLYHKGPLTAIQIWCGTFIDHDDKEQYVGAKDKNGVEIFEGDLLETEKYPQNLIHVVVYNNIFSAFELIPYDEYTKLHSGEKIGYNFPYAEGHKSRVVIGNIHHR